MDDVVDASTAPQRVSAAGRTLTDAELHARLRDRFDFEPRSELDLQRRKARIAAEWIDEQVVRREAERRDIPHWRTTDTDALLAELIGPPPPISDEQERAFYDGHPHLYRREAHLRANEIVLFNFPRKPSRVEELERIRAQILDGAGFVGMATRLSEAPTAPSAGDMGKVTASTVEPEIWTALSGLEENQVAEVLDLGDRAVLLRRRESREALILSFEEARDDIRERIDARRLESRRASLLADLRENSEFEDAEAARLQTMERRRSQPRKLQQFEHVLPESPDRLEAR